jgi:hypothetical protein
VYRHSECSEVAPPRAPPLVHRCFPRLDGVAPAGDASSHSSERSSRGASTSRAIFTTSGKGVVMIRISGAAPRPRGLPIVVLLLLSSLSLLIGRRRETIERSWMLRECMYLPSVDRHESRTESDDDGSRPAAALLGVNAGDCVGLPYVPPAGRIDGDGVLVMPGLRIPPRFNAPDQSRLPLSAGASTGVDRDAAAADDCGAALRPLLRPVPVVGGEEKSLRKLKPAMFAVQRRNMRWFKTPRRNWVRNGKERKSRVSQQHAGQTAAQHLSSWSTTDFWVRLATTSFG